MCSFVRLFDYFLVMLSKNNSECAQIRWTAVIHFYCFSTWIFPRPSFLQRLAHYNSRRPCMMFYDIETCSGRWRFPVSEAWNHWSEIFDDQTMLEKHPNNLHNCGSTSLTVWISKKSKIAVHTQKEGTSEMVGNIGVCDILLRCMLVFRHFFRFGRIFTLLTESTCGMQQWAMIVILKMVRQGYILSVLFKFYLTW